MKIVCISMSKIPSDSANSIQVMKVCQAFTQLGHEVILLVPGPQPKDLQSNNLLAHYGLMTLFKIEWLLAGSRRMFPWKAIAHAHHLGADLLYVWPVQSAVLGLLAGMPSILELHDFPAGHFGPLWFQLFRALPGRKRILPITNALRRDLKLPKEQTIIAPNGVELERYATLPDTLAVRKELNLPAGKTVLCTGHLYAGRGADLFLNLAAKFPAVSFVWVGGRTEDVVTWRQRAADLPNVTLTGFIPNQNIPLYQAAADVLLMPYERMIAGSSGGNSADICSPMKMFEYMASGRAIITSDLPVLHEVLDDKSAVFCPPGAIEAWGSALGALLTDDERRRILGLRARRVVQGYSWIERARRSLEGF
jgi:glycosyltransferase involved in cell wall biosynthesis